MKRLTILAQVDIDEVGIAKSTVIIKNDDTHEAILTKDTYHGITPEILGERIALQLINSKLFI